MNDELFEKIVEHALKNLPLEFREKMHNVSVRFEDWPSNEQLERAGVDSGLLLGLYEGVPRTKGGHYMIKLPDSITLFKYPLLRVSRSVTHFYQNVRSTLIHEIGHHFGMNEEDVRRAESMRVQS